MQSLSAMLSPLRNCPAPENSSPMDFQTPLSITIPPNDYDMEVQDNDHIQHPHNQSSWPLTYNQQPLLTSKSPEGDSLTQLNMQVGNKYTYRMHSLESGSYDQLGAKDPRKDYDNPSFTTESIAPYKDLYYKCVYEQPKAERTAIRHKLGGDEDGPAAKRHCGELNGVEIGHPVIVPSNAVGANENKG